MSLYRRRSRPTTSTPPRRSGHATEELGAISKNLTVDKSTATEAVPITRPQEDVPVDHSPVPPAHRPNAYSLYRKRPRIAQTSSGNVTCTLTSSVLVHPIDTTPNGSQTPRSNNIECANIMDTPASGSTLSAASPSVDVLPQTEDGHDGDTASALSARSMADEDLTPHASDAPLPFVHHCPSEQPYIPICKRSECIYCKPAFQSLLEYGLAEENDDNAISNGSLGSLRLLQFLFTQYVHWRPGQVGYRDERESGISGSTSPSATPLVPTAPLYPPPVPPPSTHNTSVNTPLKCGILKKSSSSASSLVSFAASTSAQRTSISSSTSSASSAPTSSSSFASAASSSSSCSSSSSSSSLAHQPSSSQCWCPKCQLTATAVASPWCMHTTQASAETCIDAFNSATHTYLPMGYGASVCGSSQLVGVLVAQDSDDGDSDVGKNCRANSKGASMDSSSAHCDSRPTDTFTAIASSPPSSALHTTCPSFTASTLISPSLHPLARALSAHIASSEAGMPFPSARSWLLTPPAVYEDQQHHQHKQQQLCRHEQRQEHLERHNLHLQQHQPAPSPSQTTNLPLLHSNTKHHSGPHPACPDAGHTHDSTNAPSFATVDTLPNPALSPAVACSTTPTADTPPQASYSSSAIRTEALWRIAFLLQSLAPSLVALVAMKPSLLEELVHEMYNSRQAEYRQGSSVVTGASSIVGADLPSSALGGSSLPLPVLLGLHLLHFLLHPMLPSPLPPPLAYPPAPSRHSSRASTFPLSPPSHAPPSANSTSSARNPLLRPTPSRPAAMTATAGVMKPHSTSFNAHLTNTSTGGTAGVDATIGHSNAAGAGSVSEIRTSKCIASLSSYLSKQPSLPIHIPTLATITLHNITSSLFLKSHATLAPASPLYAYLAAVENPIVRLLGVLMSVMGNERQVMDSASQEERQDIISCIIKGIIQWICSFFPKHNPITSHLRLVLTTIPLLHRTLPLPMPSFRYLWASELPVAGKREYFAASLPAFLHRYLALPSTHRSVYEVLRSTAPCRLFLDLEYACNEYTWVHTSVHYVWVRVFARVLALIAVCFHTRPTQQFLRSSTASDTYTKECILSLCILLKNILVTAKKSTETGALLSIIEGAFTAADWAQHLRIHQSGKKKEAIPVQRFSQGTDVSVVSDGGAASSVSACDSVRACTDTEAGTSVDMAMDVDVGVNIRGGRDTPVGARLTRSGIYMRGGRKRDTCTPLMMRGAADEVTLNASAGGNGEEEGSAQGEEEDGDAGDERVREDDCDDGKCETEASSHNRTCPLWITHALHAYRDHKHVDISTLTPPSTTSHTASAPNTSNSHLPKTGIKGGITNFHNSYAHTWDTHSTNIGTRAEDVHAHIPTKDVHDVHTLSTLFERFCLLYCPSLLHLLLPPQSHMPLVVGKVVLCPTSTNYTTPLATSDIDPTQMQRTTGNGTDISAGSHANPDLDVNTNTSLSTAVGVSVSTNASTDIDANTSIMAIANPSCNALHIPLLEKAITTLQQLAAAVTCMVPIGALLGEVLCRDLLVFPDNILGSGSAHGDNSNDRNNSDSVSMGKGNGDGIGGDSGDRGDIASGDVMASTSVMVDTVNATVPISGPVANATTTSINSTSTFTSAIASVTAPEEFLTTLPFPPCLPTPALRRTSCTSSWTPTSGSSSSGSFISPSSSPSVSCSQSTATPSSFSSSSLTPSAILSHAPQDTQDPPHTRLYPLSIPCLPLHVRLRGCLARSCAQNRQGSATSFRADGAGSQSGFACVSANPARSPCGTQSVDGRRCAGRETKHDNNPYDTSTDDYAHTEENKQTPHYIGNNNIDNLGHTPSDDITLLSQAALLLPPPQNIHCAGVALVRALLVRLFQHVVESVPDVRVDEATPSLLSPSSVPPLSSIPVSSSSVKPVTSSSIAAASSYSSSISPTMPPQSTLTISAQSASASTSSPPSSVAVEGEEHDNTLVFTPTIAAHMIRESSASIFGKKFSRHVVVHFPKKAVFANARHVGMLMHGLNCCLRREIQVEPRKNDIFPRRTDFSDEHNAGSPLKKSEAGDTMSRSSCSSSSSYSSSPPPSHLSNVSAVTSTAASSSYSRSLPTALSLHPPPTSESSSSVAHGNPPPAASASSALPNSARAPIPAYTSTSIPTTPSSPFMPLLRPRCLAHASVPSCSSCSPHTSSHTPPNLQPALPCSCPFQPTSTPPLHTSSPSLHTATTTSSTFPSLPALTAPPTLSTHAARTLFVQGKPSWTPFLVGAAYVYANTPQHPPVCAPSDFDANTPTHSHAHIQAHSHTSPKLHTRACHYSEDNVALNRLRALVKADMDVERVSLGDFLKAYIPLLPRTTTVASGVYGETGGDYDAQRESTSSSSSSLPAFTTSSSAASSSSSRAPLPLNSSRSTSSSHEHSSPSFPHHANSFLDIAPCVQPLFAVPPPPTAPSFYDLAVYTRNRCFRLLYSAKRAKQKFILLPSVACAVAQENYRAKQEAHGVSRLGGAGHQAATEGNGREYRSLGGVDGVSGRNGSASGCDNSADPASGDGIVGAGAAARRRAQALVSQPRYSVGSLTATRRAREEKERELALLRGMAKEREDIGMVCGGTTMCEDDGACGGGDCEGKYADDRAGDDGDGNNNGDAVHGEGKGFDHSQGEGALATDTLSTTSSTNNTSAHTVFISPKSKENFDVQVSILTRVESLWKQLVIPESQKIRGKAVLEHLVSAGCGHGAIYIAFDSSHDDTKNSAVQLTKIETNSNNDLNISPERATGDYSNPPMILRANLQLSPAEARSLEGENTANYRRFQSFGKNAFSATGNVSSSTSGTAADVIHRSSFMSTDTESKTVSIASRHTSHHSLTPNTGDFSVWERGLEIVAGHAPVWYFVNTCISLEAHHGPHGRILEDSNINNGRGGMTSSVKMWMVRSHAALTQALERIQTETAHTSPSNDSICTSVADDTISTHGNTTLTTINTVSATSASMAPTPTLHTFNSLDSSSSRAISTSYTPKVQVNPWQAVLISSASLPHALSGRQLPSLLPWIDCLVYRHVVRQWLLWAEPLISKTRGSTAVWYIQNDLGNRTLRATIKFVSWRLSAQMESISYVCEGAVCWAKGRPHKSNKTTHTLALKTGVYTQKCFDPDCRRLGVRPNDNLWLHDD